MIDNPLMNAFITLILTVGALGLALFFVKKYASKSNGSNGLSKMKVRGKLSLSPKSHIYIVEVEGKRLVVGANDNSINTLTELDKIEEEKTENLEPNQFVTNSEDDLSFKSFIKQAMGKQN